MCTTAPEPPSSRARELRTPVPILEMDPNCNAGGSELVTFCQKASVEPRERVVQTLRDCVTRTASEAPLIKIIPRKITRTHTASHPREGAATAYGTARPRQLDIADTFWHPTTRLLQLPKFLHTEAATTLNTNKVRAPTSSPSRRLTMSFCVI